MTHRPESGEFTFRQLAFGDLPQFREWLARPHVAEWWGALPTLDELARDYGPAISGAVPDHCAFALWRGEAVGFVQSYLPVRTHAEGWWLDEHDPGVRGIDQFLANEAQLGQGLGTAMVHAFVTLLLTDPEVTRVQTDPSPSNGRAIRCYEKAGFRRTGEVDTPDGRALLMHCDRDTLPVAS